MSSNFKSLNTLPGEILLRILDFLPNCDKNCVALVSTKYKNLASDPFLWRRFKVTKRLVDCYGLEPILKFKRFSRLSVMNFNFDLSKGEVACVFKYLLNSPDLLEFSISDCDLSFIPAYPLSEGLKRVSSLSLECCRLNTEQLIALFSKMRSRKLRHLNLSGNILSHVPPDLLIEVTTSTLTLNLSLTDLTQTQCTEVVSRLQPSTVLQLDLSHENLALLSPQVFAAQLSGVECVRITAGNVTEDQVVHLLNRIVSDECAVRDLDLEGIPLSHVSSATMAATSRLLRRLNLNNCWLTTEQLTSLLTAAAAGGGDGESRLHYLNISGNNLTETEPSLIPAAVRHLSELELGCARVSSCHIHQLIQLPTEPTKSGEVILFAPSYVESKHYHKLKYHPRVRLVGLGQPSYRDETSCSYGLDSSENTSL